MSQRKEEELVHLDTKLRDRATQLEKVDDDIRSRNECLHRLRLDVEQNTKQNEMLQLSLDKQIEKKWGVLIRCSYFDNSGVYSNKYLYITILCIH